MNRSLVNQSADYEDAIKASSLFSTNRLVDEIKNEINSARLFCYSLRSLDIYGPTKKLIEEKIVQRAKGDCLEDLESAVTGLNFLIAARYHPIYRDHRALPALQQYHLAWMLVEKSLRKSSEEITDLERVYTNFARSINSVVSGNGIYTVNWKTRPPQSTTLYDKVGLEISRLCTGESVGIYTVKVKGKGSVPHHSHTFLEEHHFFPEPIQGIHQVGPSAARCIESDIVYIGHGEVHAFRNDEERDRSFVFICGSRRTGPWDFVQDITSYPGYEFPSERRFKDSVREINGLSLSDLTNASNPDKRGKEYYRRRLSPAGMPLRHDMVVVNETYNFRNHIEDLQIFVAEGEGDLETVGKQIRVHQGDVFVVSSGLPTKVINRSNLALYEFTLA